MVELTSNKCNDKWSFADQTRKETSYASHGYHKYPAKFIPQLVKKLILNYSARGDTICDPFGGCGTTAVESKLTGRNCVSIDINKLAVLITKVKLNEIKPEKLSQKIKQLSEKLDNLYDYKRVNVNKNLIRWFRPNQLQKLYSVYKLIQKEPDKQIRDLYYCCFSNIIKKCSLWYSKSVKPMFDNDKIDFDPAKEFIMHLKYIETKNRELFKLVENNNSRFDEPLTRVRYGDARNIYLKDSSVDLIVTSPPYVTSYEYADLHQLSLMWFGYADDIRKVRPRFVGTSMKNNKETLKAPSKIAEKVVETLKKKDIGLSKNILHYYNDLYLCIKEMHRILKPNKNVCIVIGNTQYKDKIIPNIQVTIELLEEQSFIIKRIIKRKLSSKIFTPYRDQYGKFTVKSKSRKKIYQYEYIIIARKI